LERLEAIDSQKGRSDLVSRWDILQLMVSPRKNEEAVTGATADLCPDGVKAFQLHAETNITITFMDAQGRNCTGSIVLRIFEPQAACSCAYEAKWAHGVWKAWSQVRQ
jgi:hypothetical protein